MAVVSQSELKYDFVSGAKINDLLFALGQRDPEIQNLNASFPVYDRQGLLKEALARILGEEWAQRANRAVYTRMVDSVNMHDDRAFVEDEGLHSTFVLICLDVDVGESSHAFQDSASGSELIFTGKDGEFKVSSLLPGVVIPFDGTKPHAYLHAADREEKVLILDFHPIETVELKL